jgi:hypothetical protein
VDTFRNFTTESPAGTAAEQQLAWASAFSTYCAAPARGRAAAACSRVERAIAASYKGNLGRRVGGLCRMLGECDAQLANNQSCVLQSRDKSGALSECLVDGVSSGSPVAGIASSGAYFQQCCQAVVLPATWISHVAADTLLLPDRGLCTCAALLCLHKNTCRPCGRHLLLGQPVHCPREAGVQPQDSSGSVPLPGWRRRV